MKKLTLILLIVTSVAFAQHGKHEKIKALKTAYITEKLDLSTAEAEKFWPIYNHYDEKFHDLRKQERNEIFERLQNGVDNLNETEANALIDLGIYLENQEIELYKKKTAELRQVISPKKIIILKKVEYEFKRELLDRYKKGKGEKGQ